MGWKSIFQRRIADILSDFSIAARLGMVDTHGAAWALSATGY